MDTNVSFLQLTNIVRNGMKTVAVKYPGRSNEPVVAEPQRDGRLRINGGSMRDAAMRTRAELGLLVAV